MSEKGPEGDVLGISKAQTDNVHRRRGTRVGWQIPGAFALSAWNEPIVHS